MFASQLLRILQTVPSDVQYETCVHDSSEEDMTMKENLNGTPHAISSGRDTDLYRLNGPRRGTHSSLLEEKGKDECWNCKFVDDPSIDNQNDTRGSTGGELQHLFTDKIVLECKPPELMVCKEINCHVVKDIWVDDGIPVCNKISPDSSKDDLAVHSFPQPLTDDKEPIIPDGLARSLENTKGISLNEHSSKDGIDGRLIAQEGPKLPSESSSDKYTAKGSNTDDSIQNTVASRKESFVDKTLPIQEFGTRSFLRSFLNSLDGEGNKIKQLPDQISSGKVVSEGHTAYSAEAGPKEDVQSNSLSYKTKAESESITFNYSSPASLIGGDENMTSKNMKQESLNSKDENDKSISSITIDGEADNPHFPKHEHRDAYNDSAAKLRRYEEGESSFSASGLITYSGPISYSGNLSVHSDGSAASGRSFAFPVLQPEWNSSPVRMTKADRRHSRKRKGWRSGILCCRF